MLQNTVSQQLTLAVREYGDRPALYFPSERVRLDFAELKRGADMASKALLGLGLQKGDHIGIWGTNSSHWVYVALGAAQVGIVFVPMNVCYKSVEIMDICLRSDVAALFMMDCIHDDSCFDTVKGLFIDGKLDRERFPRLNSVFSLADTSEGGIPGWEDFLALAGTVSDAELSYAMDLVCDQDFYMIQYTSGTTAKPKGARLHQYGVLNTANCYAHALKLVPGDVNCVPLPLFHCFGNVLTLLGCIISGSCCVYLDAFSARQTLRVLMEERCTCIMGVPTMYTALMARPEFDKAKLCVVKGGIGGAYCSPLLADAISEKFGVDSLIIGYGLTESASLCTLSDARAPASQRLHSVGKPLPGLDVSLYDPSSGVVSQELEEGEIVVRGFSVMQDYYRDPAETRKALDTDGWLHTGDLGRFDRDGCLHVTGRIKDIIIRGGENVAPSQIEELVMELDDVRDCQCVGVADPVMGEEIAAFVILDRPEALNEADIRTHIAAHMAKYKVPRYVFFTDHFPLNGSGKVLKRELKQLAAELVTGSSQAVRI